MTVDKRFALLDHDNEWRFPYQKRRGMDGAFGFAIGRDRHGEAEYTTSIERVIEAVVREGKRIRVKTIKDSAGKRGNGLSLHAKRTVKGYWLSPELAHLVDGAEYRPLTELGISGPDTILLGAKR